MEKKYTSAIIVIDVFRAFTTAAYVLERWPAHYFMATQSRVISKLAAYYPKPLLIGKPEINALLAYDIPNSPTRSQEVEVTNRTILHRTEAGAKGLLHAVEDSSRMVLAAGFVNADATVRYLKEQSIDKVTLSPMGHEATTPSLEDDACAEYITALLQNKPMCLKALMTSIRKTSGQYFFSADQRQYPSADLEICLERERFNFAIQATKKEDHAVLIRRDISS